MLKVEMSKARQRPWPLRKTGAADSFGELPFGTDQPGRPVGIPLIESNMLVGSLPGRGRRRRCGAWIVLGLLATVGYIAACRSPNGRAW